MEECYFIDRFGALKVKKIYDSDIDYVHLNCVIDGKLDLNEIYYPTILAVNEEKYLYKIKTAIKAMKHNIMYIEVCQKCDKNVDEYPIIVYKNDKNLGKAILFVYLKNKHKSDTDINPVDYILNDLYGYGIEYNKRYFLQKYINRILPQELPDKVEKIMSNDKLDMSQKYMAKYKLAKENDNFQSFNKIYKNVKEEAQKLLKTVMNSTELKTFAKSVKPKKFKFSVEKSIGKNPLYNNVKHKVEAYAKSINVQL